MRRESDSVRSLVEFHVHSWNGLSYPAPSTPEKLEQEIKSFPDDEKLRLVDAMLADLEAGSRFDRIRAEEAGKRWAAYKAGRAQTSLIEEVMSKYGDK